MGCCGDKDEILTATTTAESATARITNSSNLSSVLAYRDTLRLILERLGGGGGDSGVSELAGASCVCRLWNSVAYELVVEAFKANWKLGEVIGKPVSGSFWRDSGIWKFAISHRIVRGDSVASLAVKYSVQVMDIKRLNNMMSDHGIYSRERLLIPISNPDILVNGVCYIELDTYAKREVAVLYLEGGPSGNSSHMLNKMTTEQGKRKVLDSLKRSMQVDDGTAQYYLSISNGNPRAALSEFSEDLKWERQMSLA
ncbi:F-box protein At1g55000 [Quercus robur]|uniref:F-box protein At1g55000 n=1 Tax=Quercus robur TaxID=38942 RepID=UPI0021630914|nr:F-box protein At1g55000 [Quercus robur]